MKKNAIIIFLFFSIFFSSCQMTRQIRSFDDLESSTQGIQIICSDSTVYYFNSYGKTDSSIRGKGTAERNFVVSDFDGEVLFRDMVYIQRREFTFWGSLVFAVAAIYVVNDAAGVMDKPLGIEPTVIVAYPYSGGSGGSCPYIYSWNGHNFKLQGEAFGTALGKQLETETCTALPDLEDKNGTVKIRLTNERPETHFFNRIKLLYAAADREAEMYCDNFNNLWTVKNATSAVSACDARENDITSLLAGKDAQYWVSDLASANSKENFEDKLFLNFQNIKGDTTALIINAINTEISTSVFKYLQNLLGNDYVKFVKAIDTDPEIADVLKKTLVRSALKVDVWDGISWKYAGLIYPEANYVPFTKLLRVPVLTQGSLKLRLRCLTDVWKLDGAFVSTETERLKTYEAELLSSNIDRNIIQDSDGNYRKLLPGEKIDLEYKIPFKDKGKKNVYAMLAEGYLYEWLIDYADESVLSKVSAISPKVALAKHVISNMDIVLPAVYEEWRCAQLELRDSGN